MQGIIIYRAIYFGAYDTAKEMFENPGIVTRFAIAQVFRKLIHYYQSKTGNEQNYSIHLLD